MLLQSKRLQWASRARRNQNTFLNHDNERELEKNPLSIPVQERVRYVRRDAEFLMKVQIG